MGINQCEACNRGTTHSIWRYGIAEEWCPRCDPDPDKLLRHHFSELFRLFNEWPGGVANLHSQPFMTLFAKSLGDFNLMPELSGAPFDLSKWLVACDWLQEQDNGDDIGGLLRRILALTEVSEDWHADFFNLKR